MFTQNVSQRSAEYSVDQAISAKIKDVVRKKTDGIEMAEFESRRAFEHLDKLGYEIGPRLAGTRGERLAAEYIENHFRNCGLKTQVQEFSFVNKVTRRCTVACLLMAAFIASLPLSPLVSLLVFLAALSLCHVLPQTMPKRRSKNVIGTLKPKKPKKHMLITAHYDSAACIVSRRLNVYLKLALAPIVCIFLIVLFARALGVLPAAWTIVWACFAIVFLPTCAGMLVAVSSRRVSPGANDNASGVAVMLEVARTVAELPPAEAELTFVAFGAEEQGLKGSRAFVADQRGLEGALVLNLDTVGVGSRLYLVEGSGAFRKCRASTNTNRLVRECCERMGLQIRPYWTIFASHDHVPLVRAGAAATTLTADRARKDRLGRMISRAFGLPHVRTRWYPHLHTIDDTPDKIELVNIERVGRVALEFIKSA